MANFVYIATSLDGYIATEDGGLDWLDSIPNPDQSDYGYADFIKRIDAIVMGRNTYEKVLTFGEWSYQKPVYVASATISKVPEALVDSVWIINGSPLEIVSALASKGAKNLYIDGGQLIQSFLREYMIDELIVTRVPILLGKGVPLFGEFDTELNFTHKSTEIYNNTLVKSHYVRL